MSSLFQNFVVFIEYGTVEMKLKDIITYLFPSYFQDILSNKACIECVDLLVKIFTTLQRNLFKKKILSKITERLYTETDLVKSNFAHINKLYINLKLPWHEEITQKDAAVVELKNESLIKEELKEQRGNAQRYIIHVMDAPLKVKINVA
ncbi:hypothetical protein evm_005420 [Chilo suppressalis]|nr:hypothetical protein evm_005420 [Chilo suppressalis]